MNELRWILLGVAIVVIFAIYYFSQTRKKSPPVSPLDAANEMPSFSAGERLTDGWRDGVGPVRVAGKPDAQIIDDFEGASVQAESSVTDTPVIDKSVMDRSAISKPVIDESVVNNSVAENIDDENTPADKMWDALESIAQQDEPEIELQTELQQEPPQAESPELKHQENNEPADAPLDDVIAVYVIASKEEPVIKGEKILSASYALNLKYGDMKIFHRYVDALEGTSDKKEILFSMANTQQPGYFDIENMHNMETKGMSFFMQANLLDSPSHVLDEMLICAHRMSTMLGAELCNAQRKPLDEAYTNYLRKKVKKLVENRQTQAV